MNTYNKTTYTDTELTSFGKHLLSEERTMNIVNNTRTGENVLDRLKEVYHADVCNWLDQDGK